MGLPAFWTVEGRVDAARALHAKGLRGKALAAELTARWGVPVSSDAVISALRRGSARSARPPPAQAEPPPAEDVRMVGEWLRRNGVRLPDCGQNYLVISDPQIPFHHPKARVFIEQVRRHYSVPKENMLCVGDEIDAYFASAYAKTPDAAHSATSEIAAALAELREWYALWPQMKLARSNHPERIVKRMIDAELPSQLLRTYREIIAAPDGWQWAQSWRIEARKPFMLEHGHHGPQGWAGLRNRALQNGISTVFGHQHANAGIAHVVTAGQSVWSMCVGSLIDREAHAFEYDRNNTFKPWVGVGVILNGGSTPLLVPFEG